jgi:hypothetical protein
MPRLAILRSSHAALALGLFAMVSCISAGTANTLRPEGVTNKRGFSFILTFSKNREYNVRHSSQIYPSAIEPVVEPPKLIRLKCANHHHRGNLG